ncbi:hypothetical protein FNF27_07231 [Cafeteria roenbergensis]|uniref:Small-subunit processome Utp21 domain-containing protein n=1 Tax=Cafeteria roenbergensis TaxID=33653 RepID=A0A5A8DTH3_CAFRO|nr:hypothetical protein FNF31_03614 [Cafeteria roenbergensis]KAA0167984.1 hypothetical protein FNF27_07231 [Cafeteria roenbergensis]
MAVRTAAKSRLFEPFRAVGVVAGDAPASMLLLGAKAFLSVPVGGSVHVYDADKLTLRLVTNPLSDDITHVAGWKDATAAASGSSLFVLSRAAAVNAARWPQDGPIEALLALGPTLVAVHRAGAVRSLDLKRLAAGEEAADCVVGSEVALELPHTAEPTCAVHPPSWLNKVIVGASDGRYRVVNVRTGRCVFVSRPLAEAADEADREAGVLPPSGAANASRASAGASVAGGSSLAALVAARAAAAAGQAAPASAAPASGGAGAAPVGITSALALPAPDIVAFGMSDGRVLVHNCRADRTIAVFRHAPSDSAPPAAVSGIAFCTDPARPPRLATATASGEIALWDLSERRLVWARPGSHAGAVTSLFFLPRESRLVSSGADNAVRQWVLDGLDELPALLRSREGHYGAVRRARFAHRNPLEAAEADGADARMLEAVTAGSDRRLRLTHCAVGLERQDREFSQGAGLVKRANGMSAGAAKDATGAAGGGDEASAVRALGPAALLRLPAITAIAVSDRREGQWCGVVSAHRGLGAAYVWDYARKALGDRTLVLPGRAERAGTGTGGGEEVTAVCISACGAFAVVAGSRGTVAKFNLQTGAPRGCFPPSVRRHRAIAMRGRKRNQAHPDLAGGGGGGGIAGDLGVSQRRRGEEEAFASANPAGADASVAYLLGARGATSAKTDTSAEAAEKAGPGGVIPAHNGSVTGLAVDGRNRLLLTAGQDGAIRWWSFDAHRAIGEVAAGAGVTALECHRPSGLVAAALETGAVRLWDSESRRLVRSFAAPPRAGAARTAASAAAAASHPHAGSHRHHRHHSSSSSSSSAPSSSPSTSSSASASAASSTHDGASPSNRVTDMAFSPDGRVLVVSHADGSVRALDLPAARVADWLWFEHPVVSLDISPAGDSLLTAHRGRQGLSVFACRSFFERIAPAAPPTEPVAMDMPAVDAEGAPLDDDVRATGSDEEDQAAAAAAAKRARGDQGAADETVVPAGRSLLPLELSGVPASRWESLPHLDAIRARSKPLQPAKAPEAAPFFLPTAQGLDSAFDKQPAGAGAGAGAGAAAAAVASGAALDAAAAFFGGAADAQPGSADEGLSGSSPVRGLASALLEAVEAVTCLRGGGASSLGEEGQRAPAPAQDSLEEAAAMEAAAVLAAGGDDEDEFDADGDEDGGGDGRAGAAGVGGAAPGGRGLEGLRAAASALPISGKTSAADAVRAALSAAAAAPRADAAVWVAGVCGRVRPVSMGVRALLRGVPAALAWRTLEHLSSLSPAAADAAVTSLCLGAVDLPGRARLLALIRVLSLAVATHAWFDIAQAHLGLLLRAHADTVAACPELRRALALLEPEQCASAAGAAGVLDQLAGMSRWIVRAV